MSCRKALWMAGYDTLVALVVQPNAQQLWDAEEYRKLELQSSAPRRTHRVTFFNLALAKHVNIVFFQPALQNVSPKQFLPQITCTAFVYASNWPTWSTKCFPPNNICSRIYVWYVFKFSQIDSATYVVFPNRFCYICCFLLGMRRLSLMQLMMGAFSGLLVWIVC